MKKENSKLTHCQKEEIKNVAFAIVKLSALVAGAVISTKNPGKVLKAKFAI